MITNIYQKPTGIIFNDEKLSGATGSNRNPEGIKERILYSRHMDIKNRQLLYSIRRAMKVYREKSCDGLADGHLIQTQVLKGKKKFTERNEKKEISRRKEKHL